MNRDATASRARQAKGRRACAARLAAAAVWLALAGEPAAARDAAFVDPGSSVGMTNGSDAIKVEPKTEIDIGDSPVNVSRRTTLFFTNQTTNAIQIEKMAVTGDSNVKAELANDDCSKQVSLAPASRCSVDVVVTPTGPGAWNVETLMTHTGAGRLARARIFGKTTGAASLEKHDQGLFLNTKDVKPVDFGEVAVGEGKTVRSALMINDSAAPITLYAIDVIEADNGLQRLDQGCAVDMELKPGESCPVTLVWTPTERGRISTDLIIRHSGQLGFVVIPIRGVAKGNALADKDDKSSDGRGGKGDKGGAGKSSQVSPPPSATELDRALGGTQAVSAAALGAATAATTGGGDGVVHLIGTVGNRALLFKPDGTTAVVQAGDEIESDMHKIKVVVIAPKSMRIMFDGKPKVLELEAASELTRKAAAARQTAQAPASAAPSPKEAGGRPMPGVPGTAAPEAK